MKKNLITGLVLSAFALVCGLLLSVVNSFTHPVIEEQQKAKLESSIGLVLDGVEYSSVDTINAKTLSTDSNIKSTYIAYNGDEKVAYIYVIDEKGFASTVKTMIAVDSNKKIIGYNIISEAETSGKNIKEANLFNMNGASSIDDFTPKAGATFSSNKALKPAFEAAFAAAELDWR